MGEKNKVPFQIKPFTEDEKREHSKVYKLPGDWNHNGNPFFLNKFHDKHLSRVGAQKYTMILYEEIAVETYNLKLNSRNVVLNSFPRSGTTWTQEMMWLLNSGLDFNQAKSQPLTHRFPTFEYTAIKQLQDGTLADEFQLLSTHIPLSLLPPSLLDTCKLVYIARDPRDVIVSNYFFEKDLERLQDGVTFEQYFNMFIKDERIYCPYFAHVKEAWQKRDHPNMLFILYEEMWKDLKAVARRMATFLGRHYSEQQLDMLCDHLQFENIRKNTAVSKPCSDLVQHFRFIRKGVSGGWREHFNEHLAARAQRWIEDNITSSDLTFSGSNLTFADTNRHFAT